VSSAELQKADLQKAEIHFQVLVDSTAPALVERAISFETGASRAQVEEPSNFAYEHHGEDFSPRDSGALTRFYEDLLEGVAFPLTFATKSIKGIDTLMAIALFLHRDLAIHPSTPGLVTAVDLIHRKGLPFLGHVDADLARFLQGMMDFFPVGVSKQEMGERIASATQWIRGYVIEGTLPNVGPLMTKPRLIEVGTNGFVLAEAGKPSLDVWGDLYRQGFLRGVLLGPEDRDFRQVIASRKSDKIAFDLNQAAYHLNELERLSGGEANWRVDGHYLFGPPDGSLVLVAHMLGVFLRV
jgi:hypothetical protein